MNSGIYDEYDVVMHIASLVCVAKTDGCISSAEMSYMEHVAAVYSAVYARGSFDNIMVNVNNVNMEELLKWQSQISEVPQMARKLVLDMVALAYADDEFDDLERNAINAVACKLGIAQNAVNAFERAVVESIASTRVLQSLLQNGVV